jgi:holo-[acyl-carrier protein] synthase
MTQGLGSDIIEISRMRTSIERHGQHFLNRLFSQKEQDYCYKFQDPAPHFTGKFAAKEAVAKALGTGFGAHLSWHDLEILNNEKGQPHVFFSEAAALRFQNPSILISVSHCTNYAVAVAIWK